MKYAVIRTGGKQYRVTEGDVIEVERLDIPQGEKVIFTDVLLVTDEDKTLIGTPLVSNFPVVGEVVEHNHGDKIRVSKYKAKVRYRRVTGHRQALSTIKIAVIGKETSKKVEKPIEASKETVAAEANVPSSEKTQDKKAVKTPKKAEAKTKTTAKKTATKKKE